MDVLPQDEPLSPGARAAATAWFGPGPLDVGPLSTGGFSGSPIFRVRARGTTRWHVLKAFAAGTDRPRAKWVHEVVRHVAAGGVPEIPAPAAAVSGDTVVTDAGGLHWELVPYVAGAAVEIPSRAQAAAALDTLARVHAAAATLPGSPPRVGPSPGVTRRIARARELAARPWPARRAACASAGDSFAAAVGQRWDRAIGIFAARGDHAIAALAEARVHDVELQPVLRDVWHAHVLFEPGTPGRVAGIVDAHAADIDTPATDVARLLGSWRHADEASPADLGAAWPDALAAYAAVRPAAAVDPRLATFLHAAGVVCGLDNWFRWVLEERRSFPVPGAALTRIDRLVGGLSAALEWLAACVRIRV